MGKASTVFEMEMGMVDRGADLGWLSQCNGRSHSSPTSRGRYHSHPPHTHTLADPHEQEILFSPLMGQQALSTRVVGSTLVVETRLNLNMQSLTLEEVTSKRRKVVKDMVENVLADFGGEGKQYLEGLLEPLHT